MKTSAIIIAAYRATPWIGECLESWDKVRVPDGWVLDIRIGVDGCEDTAKTLEGLGVPYWYSEENVGPYLIRNALIMHERADAYTIFDADDRALPCHQELLLPLAGEDGVSAGACYVIDATGQRIRNRPLPLVNGVCTIAYAAWDRLGGFRPWRLLGDVELHRRSRTMRIPNRSTRRATFERRRHPGSLTRAKATGFGSPERKEARRAAHAHGRKRERVEPDRAVMEWRAARQGSGTYG